MHLKYFNNYEDLLCFIIPVKTKKTGKNSGLKYQKSIIWLLWS